MTAKLEFTGERYHPEIGGNLLLEHVHRYLFACRFVQDRQVLDIACGEGFGANILARTARSVIGVDIDESAIRHAEDKYRLQHLSFLTGSVTAIPLAAASIDVVVSFETIEHVDAHDAMLAEIKRVLRPGGVLIMSTPDKAVYSDATGQNNPYHVKELYREEFAALIAAHFDHHCMHGQKVGFGSLIAAECGSAPFSEVDSANSIECRGLRDPMYLVTIASDNPGAIGIGNGFFAQDIQASEPVQVRVEFEKTILAKQFESEKALINKSFESERIRLEKQCAERQFDLTTVFISDLNWIANEIQLLQGKLSANPTHGMKTIRRTIVSHLLYGLANFKGFSERRRGKFRRSAEKRDPLLMRRRFERFSDDCLARIAQNKIVKDHALQQLARLGIRVTAIVPNYNHAKYLKQRLDSIIAQTYPHIDIIVLDDASQDDSRKVIESYAKRFSDRITTVFNAKNSGNVFLQWQQGHALATGDLIWICESDDFCEPTFVERMVSSFRDPSVMLAFGRVEFVDEGGSHMPGLETYREQAEGGVWGAHLVRPAARWFDGAFGVKNLIANVGGSLWRRTAIDDSVWAQARSFKVMGDWYLYAALAQGGQIAYEPSALAYFRIHGANTSGARAQSRPDYYDEYTRLMTALKHRWPVSDATVDRFVASCRSVYDAAGIDSPPFDDLVCASTLKRVQTPTLHVLMGMLGFSYGGGEIFPIHLANALARQGVMVSVLQMWTDHDHDDVRALLDPAIPVYRADALRQAGGKAFIDGMGVSIIHSHVASVEMLLLAEMDVQTPYVATLHGSYEAMDVGKRKIAAWTRRIDRYVYTADRNLRPFEGVGAAQAKFQKFSNAMPVDARPFDRTRQQLGIAEDALVFAFVARGIAGKGWVEAVRSFQGLRARHPGRSMALLAVGEGEFTNEARQLAGGDPAIVFLGYVNRIHGLYRRSDVALIPTRFPGESYPLCLIQALQVGVPAVATDIGEIKSMLESQGHIGGLTIANTPDDEAFVAELTSTMERFLDAQTRSRLADGAKVLGERYNIDALATDYLQLYRSVIEQSRASEPASAPIRSDQ